MESVFGNFLDTIALRFAPYRSLFRAMNRNIREAFPEDRMLTGLIGDAVKNFREGLSHLAQIHEDYRSDGLDLKVMCSSPHVRAHSLLYISDSIIQEIHGALFAEPVGLSGPNLRLLAHAIARDAVSVIHSKSRTTPFHSHPTSLIMLDYDDDTGLRVKGDIVEPQKGLPGYPAVWDPYYWMQVSPSAMSRVSIVACLARGTATNPRDSQALAAMLTVMPVDQNRPSEKSIFRVRWIHCR
ncbi:hypothetical protein HWV62_41509 [Athelia sp. TMB]|nr:hypothetical protein HWV62_41509 [Athelia sp. TMB]